MRRTWLALGTGLAIAGALTAAMYATVTRSVPGGHETLSLTIALPPLLYLNIPGIALMWLTLFLAPMNGASSQMSMHALVTIGNAIFYGLVAYLGAGLFARWRRT
jgi:drug/metabolite transporter (DMT)-like permease